MEFSGQGYWSGEPLPFSEDLLAQGSNLGLLHCRPILYCLSHQAKGAGYTQWLRVIRIPFLRWWGEGKLASPEPWVGWYFNKSGWITEGKRKNGCCLNSQECLPLISHQEVSNEQWIRNRLFLNWDGYEGTFLNKKKRKMKDFKIPCSLVKFAPFLLVFSSVQSLSCVRLCNPTDCSSPGLPVHRQLPEFTQTHVHWVSDVIQLSHPLLAPSPPAFNLSR